MAWVEHSAVANRTPKNPATVPLFRSMRTIGIDADATYGAQLGIDLLMPDGSIATTAKLQALLGSGSGSSGGPGTTDELNEGLFNLYFTDKRAQSAVGDILENTSDIQLTYDGTGNTIEAVLTATGVVAGDYGTPSPALVAFSVDSKGRLIEASQVSLVAGAGISFITDPLTGAVTIYLTGLSTYILTEGGDHVLAEDGSFIILE